jgi:4'-phosphopantetheinyl transferase EntD
MKACRHCGEHKDKSEFPVHREKCNGLSSWCRACHADACARWRAKHPEKIDAYNARRRAEYAAMREAEHHAARKVLNKRLREQVRQNRQRDERLRERFGKTAA